MTFMVMQAHKSGTFTHHEAGHEHAIYVVKGTVTVSGETYTAKKMIVFKDDSAIEVQHSTDAVFALIGGKAFSEPRYIWWNLVSSDQEKIEMAKRQWKEKTFPQVPGEDDIIPLPEN
jgi:redox-sensitive bicupin YhaK (pirin superfamily)